MNVDLVVVGEPFEYMKDSIPKGINLFIEYFNMDDGYNKALNNGAKKGNSDYIGFCNNDLKFYDNSISILVDKLSKYDSVSPYCPKSHHKYGWRTKPNDDFLGYQTGKVVAGWCFFMRRESYNLIGGFDDRIKFWGCDNATSEQFFQNKIKHALIPDAEVSHMGSQTLKKVSNKDYDKMTRDQLTLFRKLYGFGCFDKRYKK